MNKKYQADKVVIVERVQIDEPIYMPFEEFQSYITKPCLAFEQTPPD